MIHTLPMPVKYDVHGAEGQQIAPEAMIQQALQQLLDSIGVPVDFYKSSLTIQAAPVALRLFEATWSQLVDQLNDLLQMLAKKVSKLMNWSEFGCRLKRVTHADDLNRQMAVLQLAQAGKISETRGLESVGLSFSEEMQQQIEDEKFRAKLQQRAQKELEQQDSLLQMTQAGDPTQQPPPGATGPGGAPADPAQAGAAPGGMAQQVSASLPAIPNKPQSLDEMQQMAQQQAQQIAGMPESQKDSTLIGLKKENPVLHALVGSVLSDIRRKAALQGRDMVMRQQFGPQAGM